ncbi:MAG: Bax inhibitor-1/YccA family protein [Alphaproteobacteria bacterium]|nr:Bax inhibitor-1/YccA family protein [Alphaproteobacteria bacterium]
MTQYENRYAQAATTARTGAAVDEGLRSYMLGVYNYMSAGVALTGVVAYAVSSYAEANPAVAQLLYHSPLKWVLMLAPLAFVLVLSFGLHKLSAAATQGVFWAFAGIMGLSLSVIFLIYTNTSIFQTFIVTSGAFAGLSLYGYTTKQNLSGWGSFLIMGVIGIIIAMVVNWFLQSSALGFAISVIGLLVFAGLTAYDTQRIKDEYLVIRHDAEMVAKASVMGALSLYLDFVNMFQFLLSFMGNRE